MISTLFRGACFNLSFTILTLIMGLGALPLRILCNKNSKLPLRYAQAWSQATIAIFKKTAGVQLEITGALPEAGKAALLLPQHQSFFDGFIWMILLSDPAYVLKTSLTKIPLVGPMLIKSGMIPIEREGGGKTLIQLLQRVNADWKAGRQIILFPEGTRVLPGARHPLEKGCIALQKVACKNDIPIYPAVTNSGCFWPKNPWRKSSGILKLGLGPAFTPEALQTGDFLQTLEQSWRRLEKENGLADGGS